MMEINLFLKLNKKRRKDILFHQKNYKNDNNRIIKVDDTVAFFK